MKIIAFINQKGGVGKTTSAVNIAAYLAEAGKKVLLIDTDPQGNATSGVGVSKKAVKESVYHVLTEGFPIKDAILPTETKNLAILPADLELAGAEAELISFGPDREKYLKTALKEIDGVYDFVIIDCPPSLGLITINALTAATGIIIPVQCEFYALEGLSQLMYTVKQVKKHLNPNLEIEGILLTMFDKRASLTTDVEEEVKKFFGGKVFETKIPRNVRLAEAPSHGEVIAAYDKHSKGAKAYEEVTKEYLRRLADKMEEDN